MTHFQVPLLKYIVLWVLVLGLGLTFAIPAKANTNTEKFKITTKTLEQLKQANLPKPLLSALEPLLNELFTSKEAFLKILNTIQNPSLQPEHLELVLQHALLNNLWIDFDKAELDFESGESVLTGNVKGGIPKENLLFWADKVRIVTEGPERFNKIVAESNVRVEQLGRVMTTDRAIYNRLTQILDLVGNIVIQGEGVTLYGTTANVNRQEERTEVQGHNGSDQRVRVEYASQTIDAIADSPDQEPTVVQAQRAVLENTKQQAIFEGNVEMFRPQRQLYLAGGKILLFFNEDRKLVASRAEQKVCIEQPGRAARADQAEVDEPTQSIFLKGNAEINRGGIYLKGPTINVFLDVEKGEAIGDSNTPVQMVIPLDEDNTKESSTSQHFTCR